MKDWKVSAAISGVTEVEGTPDLKNNDMKIM
jgi:hypothetical protein